MATLSEIKRQYLYGTGAYNLLTENQRQLVLTRQREAEEASKNQGGFFGGIGYAFEKLGLGFLSSIEGIWDYTAGGLAKLFGADDWAEQQFANDWVDYGHADEWFNPSEGWQFVGDVAGGIGTSVPAIATVVIAGAIAAASGGSLTPVSAALISGAVAGLGAAGNATKEAYRQTGELGGKEFGYGALVGITEGAVEGVSAGIGVGTGQIVKGISKSFGKEIAETAARETLGKVMIKGFIGEAFEEGLSEILDPVWARLTYDPNAKNATVQEVGYAALVGGLSGAIMSGFDVSIRNVHSTARGNTIVTEGKAGNVISMAEQLSAYESENHTGYEQFQFVDSTLKELQTSMEKTNGEIKTLKQKMLLGTLEKANTTAAFTPFIARSAENIVNNADIIAEKLTSYGIKDAQGNPVTFTAEEIRSGIEFATTDKNGNPLSAKKQSKITGKSFSKAMKTNSVLRALAVADATGHLSMETAKFKDATLRGQHLSSQADLNQFIENATDAERQAVGERLGIDDWNALTNEQFHQKIVEFSKSGGVEVYQQERATIQELQSIDPTTARKMPARLNLKKDGTVRYTDGNVNIAVTKNGDTYRVYDYDSGKYSKPLTLTEANRTIREIRKAQNSIAATSPIVADMQQTVEQQGAQQQTATTQQTESQSALRKIAEQANALKKQAKEIDAYARENIPDYTKLNAQNQSMVRSVIRQGRAAGIADADVLSYARVSAHTGLNVVFDKSLCVAAVNSETGEKIYSDGYYDVDANRFVINPETTRTHESLLLHELTHAIYRTVDGKLVLERGVKNMSQTEKNAIIKRYSDIGHGGAIELMDEINAHYAEGVLTNKNTIEQLIAEKPKLKDRILSFFKKSATVYEGDAKLSKSAKSLYNRYKKLFDSFSERNGQYNAAEYRHTAPNAETRYALSNGTEISVKESSVENDTDGNYLSINLDSDAQVELEKLPIKDRSKFVKDYIKSKFRDVKFTLNDGKTTVVTSTGAGKIASASYNVKQQTALELDKLFKVAEYTTSDSSVEHSKFASFDYYKARVKVGNDFYSCVLNIGVTKTSGLYQLYDVNQFIKIKKGTPAHSSVPTSANSVELVRNVPTNSISENSGKVNRNGKKSNSKRYALQIGNETTQVDVEETKNLVALHNLSEEKLLKVLQLGGFPMPSIAVTKADLSHTDYGDITVVFGKETISPTDRRNKVYKRDAWTPTMPQVDVKFDTKELDALEKSMCAAIGNNAEYRSDIQRFFDEFHNYNGDYYVSERDYDSSSIAKKAERYAGVTAAYLSEKGISTEPVYKDRKFMQGDFTVSEIQAIADKLGITRDNFSEFNASEKQETATQKQQYQDIMNELKRAYIENYTRRGVDNKSATEIADELGYRDFYRYMDALKSVLSNNDTKEYDSRATAEALRNRITDTADFEKWLFDKISATEERRGIDNGAETFTASGKRRSFAQMHDEYTIQNIVRNMLRGEQHGSTFFGHNANSIAARLADEFTSIKSIKEASHLLTEISESEYDALMEKTFDMSSEIVDEIDTRSSSNGFSDSMTRREDILDMIAECATVRPLTAEKILAKWNSQYQGYDLGYKFDKQTAQKVLDWFTVLNQLPTKYFEAKPRRVVEFSEIKTVLIPESASERLKIRLTNRGVSYQVYGAGENARTDIIKSMEGIRFALPVTDSDGKRLSEQQRKYFQSSKIVDDSGKLLPVYHGSNEYGEITVFKKGKTGYLGGGIYLTTDKQYAQRYANKNGYEGRIYEAYLNVTNPLTVTSVDPAKEILRAVYGSDRVYANRTANQGSAMHLITSADINKLRAKGYDGIVWNYGGSKEISVFDSNQIKLVSNQNPTTSRDIRYALPEIDSAGKKLTEQQREFFKDSKVVDKQGQLLAVYHGTDEQFTVFDKSKFGSKTDAGIYGQGFYFAAERGEALAYGASAKKYYLNIKNPLVINRNTGYSSILDYYLKQRGIICKTNGELVDLLNSGFIIPSKAEITSVIQQNGYDGVIYEGYAPSEYVAFEPEQIKLATAKKPTQNKDIRYALPKDIAERDSAYMAAVERGDMETAQRFVDEVAREAGYKLKVYHGTPTGGFTVFKTLPAYVTENRAYAEVYQSESASSIRFGKRATTPEVKGLYLNTRYLFDTRRPAVRERFYNDYVQGGEMNGYDWYPVSGLYTELTKRGLPDWTEGESIADYIRAKKLKYNAIILDEGATGGYGFEVNDRGIAFAVMNPSALKSADAITYDDNGKIIPLSERFKTANKDIRYALPDNDFQNRVTAAQEFRDEAKQYGRRVKVNYDGSVTVYHGTSAVNANKILSTGIVNEQSYFTTNKGDADYYANDKHSGGVVLELHVDARNLEFAAAGAELYTPTRLERVDGIFASKDGRRYALKNDRTPVDGMTRGQRAKFAANNTRLKVYSKIDATEVINSIIDERLTLDDKYGSLSGKNRAQVIDTLFRKLNTTPEGYRLGVALDIADYVINNAVLTDMYDSYDDTSYAMETLSAIRRYMHRVDLSGIKSEIQYKFDKKNTVNLVWGAKQGGIAPDVIAQELQTYGINIEAINEADQFLEMLEIYEKAKSDVSRKAEKVSLTAYGSKAQIEKLRQQIARDILIAYDEKGTQSKYGKLVEKYTKQIASLTEQVKKARRINSVTNSIIDSAQYLRDIAARRNYVGAEVFSAPELTAWLKNLGKLKYRSDLRKTGARKILLDYGKFYNENNTLLYDKDQNMNYIDQNVLDALDFIQQNADSTKPLSIEELQAAQVIMSSAKHLFQNYDQMIVEGRKVRISEAAAEGNAIVQKTKSRVGRGFFNNIYGVFNRIVEPRVVIKSFENYDPNGILTRAYRDITRGETAASLQYIQLVEKFDDYFKQNKKYRNRLTSEYITVAGAELNVGQALSLYELSKREQAKEGLYESGFSYVDKKGVKHTVKITESDIEKLQSAFTDSDKQFIGIVEDFFNVLSKKVKTDADLQILGYTNAADEFYFPIQRDKGTIAKNITDARDLMADWANVYNFSFNKDVKAGAKNKIFVPEIWSVITRHAKQLSTYAHLTVPLKNFSQVYAKNIGTKTDVQTIRNTLNEQVWGGADSYLSKLFADIQGRATSNSVIEKLRGAYAKYQLGANLKVIVSQLTSYPTAGIELDFRSMVKGAVMKTDYAAMDKYCAYARVRNYEKGVVKAEGVIDKVGKVGDIFTKPIQWTDRAAIGKIWNACQVQVERTDGHKIGTVENMQAAGVLCEEVIRLTQPNYTNSERSALMRSDSDIVRSFTMFTSVPLKQLSRLVESVGEYKALRQMIKSGDTNSDIQSRYKKAKKRLGKTLASITVANLMYTMVAQFFKWLYAKDRKDKDGNEISFVQDFFTDFVSTTIGMFPVVKDIYNYFANDYEFSNFAYDSINSILSTTKNLFEVATKAAGGESLETSDYMKPFRDSLYAIGQVTGLPIRNINNTVSGIIKRFSPETAYKYNSVFYNARYSKDIKEALAKGDTELADMIMGLMLDEDKAGNLNDSARKKLIELYGQEYEVLPRSIGDSVSHNGETIKLTAQQRKKFKSIYGQANVYIERMVQNKAFNKLSAEKQAKAIKQVYDAYYDKAAMETLGIPSDNKLLLLSKFMGVDTLSIAIAGISEISSDKDKNGATVQGSKKRKVIQYLLGLNLADAQRLLILYMQGYSIGDGEYKKLSADRAKRMVISYILSLNKATQAEKTQLAQMCGAEVKNGRIITKSLYTAK